MHALPSYVLAGSFLSRKCIASFAWAIRHWERGHKRKAHSASQSAVPFSWLVRISLEWCRAVLCVWLSVEWQRAPDASDVMGSDTGGRAPTLCSNTSRYRIQFCITSAACLFGSRAEFLGINLKHGTATKARPFIMFLKTQVKHRNN